MPNSQPTRSAWAWPGPSWQPVSRRRRPRVTAAPRTAAPRNGPRVRRSLALPAEIRRRRVLLVGVTLILAADAFGAGLVIGAGA